VGPTLENMWAPYWTLTENNQCSQQVSAISSEGRMQQKWVSHHWKFNLSNRHGFLEILWQSGILEKRTLWNNWICHHRLDSIAATHQVMSKHHKLASYGTDGRLFATDVCANFKVTW